MWCLEAFECKIAGEKAFVLLIFPSYGTLFAPTETGPTQAIIEIGGSAGGLLEIRSALLASKTKRTTFCLAWYRHKDLPETMCIDIEYLVAATQWLKQQHDIVRSELKVSLYTISKGTELCFVLASKCDELFDAIAAVGPQAYLTDPSLKFQGNVIPGIRNVFSLVWLFLSRRIKRCRCVANGPIDSQRPWSHQHAENFHF